VDNVGKGAWDQFYNMSFIELMNFLLYEVCHLLVVGDTILRQVRGVAIGGTKPLLSGVPTLGGCLFEKGGCLLQPGPPPPPRGWSLMGPLFLFC